MDDLRFRALLKHEGKEVGDLPWLEEFWAVRYDDYAALQSRVAELEAEQERDHENINIKADFIEKTINQLAAEQARAEAAEALLPEAVKAWMLEGVKVKPLVWEDWSARHRTNVTAMTEFGRYGVMQLHFPELHFKIEPPHGKPSSADTLEAAKAAAQADYEARIRAALYGPDPETIARIVAQVKEGRG